MRFFWCAVALAILASGRPAASEPSTSELVAVAAKYIAHYEEQLTAVIADETSLQDIAPRPTGIPEIAQSRWMRSELFFMFEPLRREWMAIRDVIEVDGKPVAERPDLRTALRTLPAWEVAATFKASNSRFNIGRVRRNFNEPTFALLVLDRNHVDRFTFEKGEHPKGDMTGLVTLRFTERDRPTLISGVKDGAVYSKGQLVIDARTGSVRRATLGVTADGVKVDLETEYTHDAKLGMLVPAVFRERYEHVAGDRELIRCEAKYSNYRRFEVTSRIK